MFDDVYLDPFDTKDHPNTLGNFVIQNSLTYALDRGSGMLKKCIQETVCTIL